MKILMHSGFDFDPFTGIGRVTDSLGRALRSLGAEVDMLYGRGEGGDYFTYLADYFPQFSLRETVDPWWGVRRFQNFISGRRYDIVHSHARWAYHSTMARRVFGGGYKILTFVHGLPHGMYREWEREVREGRATILPVQRLKARAVVIKESFYQRAADGVVVTSQGVFEDVRRYLGLSPFLVLPGVDTEIFRPDEVRRKNFRRRHGLSDAETLCLFIGTPAWRKGLLFLLDAIDPFPASFTLCLVGLSEADRRLVRERYPRIKALDCGQVRDADALAGIYCGSDIFVLPSLYEGLPLVALEALSSGLPGVMADCNGAKDVIREGVNGFIVPKRDPEALSAALQRLIDRRRREEMGARARESVLVLTWEEMARKMMEVYGEVLAR